MSAPPPGLRIHVAINATNDPAMNRTPAPIAPTRSLLRPLLLLLVLVIAAQFVSLAFGRLDEGQAFTLIALPSLLFLSLLTLPAGWAGIVLGRRTGLGMPALDALASGQPGALRTLWRNVALAAALGLPVGAFFLGLNFLSQPYLPPEVPALGFRGVIGGLAVSLGAAVGEEVWFRFGLMTALAWLVARIAGTRSPSDAAMWTIIVLAAFGFGLAHVPQLLTHGVDTPIAIGSTIAGNVAVGTLYGWCYWRKGLPAAMAAHFTVDLVLHVLTAALP